MSGHSEYLTEYLDTSPSNVVCWAELRYWCRDWPLEAVNQLYIDMLTEQELGYY